MTEILRPESRPSSRRALLAGALGGLGAWAAASISRPSAARATGIDGDVGLGAYNTAGSTTTIDTSGNSSNAFEAISNAGTAITGNSTSGTGVDGFTSGTGSGVSGTSYGFSGVFGYTPGGTNTRGVTGVAYGDGTGVVGQSSFNPVSIPAKTKTGVYGYAGQDAASQGVWGHSPAGNGVVGSTTTGYAGYFSGKVYSTQFYEISEIGTPAAPAPKERARRSCVSVSIPGP